VFGLQLEILREAFLNIPLRSFCNPMHGSLSGISVDSLHLRWREGLLTPSVLHKVLASEVKCRNWLREAAVRSG